MTKTYPDSFAALQAGATLIAASRRSAVTLTHHYATRCQQQGAATWRAPDVLGWDAWMSRSAALASGSAIGAAGAQFVLSTAQERVLWERVIAASGHARDHRIEPLARLAMAAWTLMQQWELAPAALYAGPLSHETQAWQAWEARFRALCREQHAIDRQRYFAQLIADPDLAFPTPAGEYALLDPLPPTPLRQRWLSRLSSLGLTRVELADHNGPGTVGSYVFASLEAELTAAAEWALDCRARYPEALVVIAAPELNGLHEPLRRVFAGLSPVPALMLPLQPTPYRVEPGEGLTSSACVSAALALLQLGVRASRADLGVLLTSPYLRGHAVEFELRARLEARLRAGQQEEFGWAAALRRVREQEPACLELATALECGLELLSAQPRRQALQVWMSVFAQLLNMLGWPGDYALSPLEQDLDKQWRQALDTVAQLDAVSPPVSHARALQLLRGELAQRRVLPTAAAQAIEILSLEDAAAVRPDYVWITGLHDGAWPRRSEFNPLLPYRVLREAGVEGTDARAESEHAAILLQRLRAGARLAVGSYAALDRDAVLRPSPQWDFSGCTPVARNGGVPRAWQNAWAGAALESYSDHDGGPVTATTRLRGGVQLLTAQAACPFRAFARHRLEAFGLDEPVPGLDAMTRGTLVHQVLAGFWERCGTQQRLRERGEDGRRAVLSAVIAEVVAAAQDHAMLDAAFWALERTRLFTLVDEWLVLELQRAPFAVVEREFTAVLRIEELELRLRIDRVDRLADGSLLVIDYKTGKTSRNAWEVPRPDQPQLPMYVLALASQPVHGVAFGQVKRGECKWIDEPRGTALQTPDAEARREWPNLVATWQTELSRLARQFAAGDARVDPKRGAATCRVCDLQVLCRVHEQGVDFAQETDDDG